MYVWPKTTIIKLRALNPLKIVKLGSGFLKVVKSFQLWVNEKCLKKARFTV